MATAGKTTIGASDDHDAADDGDINGPYTVGAGSVITEYHAYLWSLNGAGANIKVRPIIYEDSAGEPGNLIATLTEIAFIAGSVTPQWRDLTGLSVPVSVDAIWIGLWFNNNNCEYAYDSPGGNPGRYKSSFAPYSSGGDAPTPWPTASDAPSTQEHSQYVTYTPAAGATSAIAWVRA